MPFLSKPTRRVSARRRPPGKGAAKPNPAKPPKRSVGSTDALPPKPPAKPQRARARKQPPRPVPTGASAWIIEARRELGTILGAAGWTQAELARAIGVKYWTVVGWEQGRKTPTQGELDVIARVLELARRGVDPQAVKAPDVEQLVAEPGPVKPPKLQSIIKNGLGPRGKNFKSLAAPNLES